MKNIPSLQVLNNLFYDDLVDLRWKVSPRYGVEIGDKAGSVHPNGYTYVKISGEGYRVHRILWMMRTGEDPGELDIDHRNRKRSDNSYDNLKLANKVMQAQNKGDYCNNTSGCTGVSQVSGGRWCAYINCDGKRIGLGRYDTKEEAIAARKGGEAVYRV